MSDDATTQDHRWPCSWSDTEAAQDRDSAAMPLWRKIQWLEEMHRMGLRVEEARRERIAEGHPHGSDDPGSE